MVLSGESIVEHINEGSIFVEPYNPELVSINSIDIRLGPDMYIQDTPYFDGRPVPINPMDDPAKNYRQLTPRLVDLKFNGKSWFYDSFLLEPGYLYLGTTLEKIGTKYRDSNDYQIVPTMNAKSTAGRLGITVALCAGMGDIGYHSRWALEIRVTKPIYLPIGAVIGQVVFHKCCPSEQKYNGPDRYQNGDSVRFLPKPLKVVL